MNIEGWISKFQNFFYSEGMVALYTFVSYQSIENAMAHVLNYPAEESDHGGLNNNFTNVPLINMNFWSKKSIFWPFFGHKLVKPYGIMFWWYTLWLLCCLKAFKTVGSIYMYSKKCKIIFLNLEVKKVKFRYFLM